MPKSDFNKVAERSHIPKQTCSFQVQVCLFMCDLLATLLKLHFDMVFSCKFAAYFQNTFSKEHLWMAAFDLVNFDSHSVRWIVPLYKTNTI